MHNLRQYEVPLHRYMAMMDLQVKLIVNINVECIYIKLVHAHKKRNY